MQDNQMRLQTCCLIGPEVLPRQALADLTPQLYRAMGRMIVRHGVCRFCSTMGDGFDLLAAQAVLHMRGGHPQVQLVLYGEPGEAPLWQKIRLQAEQVVKAPRAQGLLCPMQMLEQSAFCLACRQGGGHAVRRTAHAARQQGLHVVSLTRRPSWLL